MREWVKELGWRWVLQRLIGVMSLFEEDKTHNQRLGSSPRSEFLDKLAIFDYVLPSVIVNLPQCFSLIFSNLHLLEALLYYIVLFYSIPPSICLLSTLVLEFLSPFPQPFDFLGVKVVENTVQRSSPH